MKFEYFEIINFKGIEYLKLNLNKSPAFNVHAFVGLNESGKTTILEAINFFKHKLETLDPLELKGYKIEDIHDIIPISQRDNFKGFVEIEGGLILDETDEKAIADYFKYNHSITLTNKIKHLSFRQKYYFEDSKSNSKKDSSTWVHSTIIGKKKTSNVAKKLSSEDANKALPLIRGLIPNILYFPNFLFEFPNKIYLEESIADKKYKFYKGVIQDILDSLNNNLNIETHIINRAKSSDKNDKNHLESVLDKMSNKITTEVFNAWSSIFNKKINKKEILVKQGDDENGIYLELFVRDLDGKYLITERSLGFRWFFVFLLLTQFRGYRKKNNTRPLFLLDEPASNLHSSAQSQLLQSFEKLSEIIYTTHSHHLINPFWLENTYVVKNEGLDYLAETDSYNSSMTKITATPYREFATNYPEQRNYFQPILDVLAYSPSDLEFIDKSVFVEGKNDFYSFNYLQNVLQIGVPKRIKFIPGTSASNLESIISLYIGWGKKFVILLDSDEEGIKQKRRYIDLFGISIELIIFTYEDIDSKWRRFRIEDLYEEEDKEKINRFFYIDDSTKTNFHRSIQELLIKDEVLDISKMTKENFKNVYSFLNEKLK